MSSRIGTWARENAKALEIAMPQITNSLFDEIIFDTIIDYYREKVGYPGALPINKLTAIYPTIPDNNFFVPSGQKTQNELDQELQLCVLCNRNINVKLFNDHIKECRKGLDSLYRYAEKIFNINPEEK